MPFEFEKKVTDDWTWFSDYYNLNCRWFVRTTPGREVEVATGLMIFGMKTGQKTRVREVGSGLAGPLGSVHVRVVDGKGAAPVRYAEFEQEVAGHIGYAQGRAVPPPLSEPWNDDVYKRLRNELMKK